MREIVERLHEKRQIERAKELMESNGYTVTKRLNESISDSEMKEILSIFKSTNQDVLDSRPEEEDGATVFVVECDNSNPTYIADLQNRLESLESKGIGYDREENGNGFYGRNYIFYKYDDFNESKELDESGEDDKAYQDYMNKMKSNPTFKKIESLCSKYGYRLYGGTATTRKNGNKYIDIRIQQADWNNKEYHADIYYSSPSFLGDDSRFEIQTAAYGALTVEEYAKFLKGCQDSYDLVTELNKIDLSTLYDPSEDYVEEEE